MEFVPVKQALNRLACGFGDCIVDNNYNDGEKHRFVIKDGKVFYSRRNDPLSESPPSVHQTYFCGNFEEIYSEVL